MKKLILPAFCLSLLLTTAGVSAENESSFVPSSLSSIGNDDRKPVKPEELPEAITKALSGDAYKGWTMKEAAVVTPPVTADKAPDAYYEITLSKEKETKVIKFQKDGTLLN